MDDTETQVKLAKLESKIDNLAEKLYNLLRRFQKIEERPARHWEVIVTALITSIISFILSSFLR